MRKFLLSASIFLSAMATSAQETTTVQDLEWMTGTWRGTVGGMEIEEIWNEPRAEGIQALVRIMVQGKLFILEMISIEQEEGTLALHIKQWGPGIAELEQLQVMDLASIKENEVVFKARDTGMLKSLTYRRPSETTFEIHVESAERPPMTVSMNAVTNSTTE